MQATLPNVAVQESELSAEDRAARLRGEPIRRDFRNYSQWRGAHNRWLREQTSTRLVNVDFGDLEARVAAYVGPLEWPFSMGPRRITVGNSAIQGAPAPMTDDQLLAALDAACPPAEYLSLNAAGGLIEEAAELSQSINS